ncbi:hypothetical protein DZF91_03180 [Actinomadura logoneensis]|uniref:SAF domain-containing protein n=1 Tax=Actinomadura logoneensis TaxID=2293572 RepID=A0A372JSS2_9ACTN|nr:hypothetical protein DZF91_03180 [Actinomadura logoneensis]
MNDGFGQRRRLLAALFAASGAGLAIFAVQPPSPDTVRIAVAARDLAAGATLRASDVRIIPLPPAARPDGALRNPPVGRVLSGAVRRGEILTDARVLGPGLLDGQPPGTVATPIRVADSAAARLLRPGDRIDVLAVTAPGNASDPPSILDTPAPAPAPGEGKTKLPPAGKPSGGMTATPDPDTRRIPPKPAERTTTDTTEPTTSKLQAEKASVTGAGTCGPITASGRALLDLEAMRSFGPTARDDTHRMTSGNTGHAAVDSDSLGVVGDTKRETPNGLRLAAMSYAGRGTQAAISLPTLIAAGPAPPNDPDRAALRSTGPAGAGDIRLATVGRTRWEAQVATRVGLAATGGMALYSPRPAAWLRTERSMRDGTRLAATSPTGPAAHVATSPLQLAAIRPTALYDTWPSAIGLTGRAVMSSTRLAAVGPTRRVAQAGSTPSLLGATALSPLDTTDPWLLDATGLPQDATGRAAPDDIRHEAWGLTEIAALDHAGRAALDHAGRAALKHAGGAALDPAGRAALKHAGGAALDPAGRAALKHAGGAALDHASRAALDHAGLSALDHTEFSALNHTGRAAVSVPGCTELGAMGREPVTPGGRGVLGNAGLEMSGITEVPAAGTSKAASVGPMSLCRKPWLGAGGPTGMLAGHRLFEGLPGRGDLVTWSRVVVASAIVLAVPREESGLGNAPQGALIVLATSRVQAAALAGAGGPLLVTLVRD